MEKLELMPELNILFYVQKKSGRIKKYFDFIIKKDYYIRLIKLELEYIRKNWKEQVESIKKLDEKEINDLINQCKTGENAGAWNKFLDIYSDRIYNFPRYTLNKDKDFCGDYYVYVLEHLNFGKKFKTFNPDLAKFTTWFEIVLKNFLFEFIKKINRKKINIVKSIDEYLDEDTDFTLLDTLYDSSNDFQDDDEIKIKKIRKIIDNLDIKLRITLKLQFIFYYDYPKDLKLSELRYIQKESKSSFRDIVIRIEQVKYKLGKKYMKYKKAEEKLSEYFHSIIKIDRQLKAISNSLRNIKKLEIKYPADLKMLKKSEKRYKELIIKKNKKKKLIDRIIKLSKKGRHIIVAGKKNIAYILKINPSTVGTRLYRLNKILKEKLSKIIKD